MFIKIISNKIMTLFQCITKCKWICTSMTFGLNGISVKSHGNANPLAFSYALRQCNNFITNGLNKQIIKSIKNI